MWGSLNTKGERSVVASSRAASRTMSGIGAASVGLGRLCHHSVDDSFIQIGHA